jgi:Ca-activated chloride channel family protein
MRAKNLKAAEGCRSPKRYRAKRTSKIFHMRFENQNLLWLLLVLPPALAVFLWWALRQRQKLLTQFIQARLLPALTVGISPTRQKIRAACLFFAVALLIVTLARPQWGFTLEEVKQRGLDIVVAIDTSKSMLATDIAPNRLARAKLAAFDLMQQAKSDRLGLVAFAGNAFLQCPLTSDETAFRQSVDALDVNIIPQGGTAIAEAIRTALTAFKEGGNYKVLVLLTDGEDNDEGALDAAEAAAKEGLRIFTIGIGTEKGELLRVTDGNGNSDYIRDEQNHVVMSHLNVKLLQQIAGATEGGFYLPLSGAKTMDTLYERGLAPLPKSEHGEKTLRRYREQFYWPLAVAIVLLLVEILLPERRSPVRRGGKKTSNIQHPTSNIQSAAVAALLALLLATVAVKASPASALREYHAGNFTNALVEFTKLAEVRTNDLRLVFNAGDAAYRATNFDLAQKLFQQVTLSPDLKMQQQAFYNLGNVQFQVAKQAKDLDGLEQGFDVAAKIYERAVMLNTNDVDAVFNLRFAQGAAEQVRQIKEAWQRAKASADEAVQRAEFHRALELMSKNIGNPDMKSKIYKQLKEDIKKKKLPKEIEDFIKKLEDIDEIATPTR